MGGPILRLRIRQSERRMRLSEASPPQTIQGETSRHTHRPWRRQTTGALGTLEVESRAVPFRLGHGKNDGGERMTTYLQQLTFSHGATSSVFSFPLTSIPC